MVQLSWSLLPLGARDGRSFVDKDQDKSEGVEAHLLWVTSLTGKDGEGGELQVWIKEAKNLTAAKSGGTSDSFVKG